MKKSVVTLRLLTGLGLSASLFLGCQEFLGGNDNASPAAKTAEDGAKPRETADPGQTESAVQETAKPVVIEIVKSPIGDPGEVIVQPEIADYTVNSPMVKHTVEASAPADIHTSPPSSAPSDSACMEISARQTAAKSETNIALRDSLYQAAGAEWHALGCVSPPGPYISPEQKCQDAQYQLQHTVQNGFGPGHKYYETDLARVNQYCPPTP
jgi:hypothetical protein